jgi:hypothetical protein
MTPNVNNFANRMLVFAVLILYTVACVAYVTMWGLWRIVKAVF